MLLHREEIITDRLFRYDIIICCVCIKNVFFIPVILIVANRKPYSLEPIISLLTEYRYLILFPMAVVEGPVIAIIAGFLCANGILNPLCVFPLIVLGDITGDSICYALGRRGMPKVLKNMVFRFGPNTEKMSRVRDYFNAHPVTTISLSKITLGVGFAGIYLAGNARIPYPRFIRICLLTSVAQYLIYLGIGILFGDAYIGISRYLNEIAALFLLAGAALLFFFFIQSIIKKI